MLTIDLQTARRYILGKQGLWPGRRWRGLEGVEQAMRAIEYLQLDPLQILARSHDLQLHSRVADTAPGAWEEVSYRQRKFFDWGGWLAARPMDELPVWRVVMRREREHNARLRATAHEHAAAVAEMRAVLAARGTVSNRDFSAAERARTQSYRGRKDSALALYYLWRVGDVMTHHRENFERVYALSEAVAPPALLAERGEAEADRHLVLKDVRFAGLSRLARTADAFFRGVPFDHGDMAGIIAGLLAEGALLEVRVEGWKQPHYAPGADAPLLAELAAGRVPAEWSPLETTTTEEAVFLAPLDPVSARGRAKVLFGFDYIWEVYKPAPLRKFGYYTLPVLWGDRLVARFDSKLDRAARALVILGLWLEDAALEQDGAFAEALAAGFARLGGFLGAESLDVSAVADPALRRRLGALRL